MTDNRSAAHRAGRLWLIPCLLLVQLALAGSVMAAEAQSAGSTTQSTGRAQALTKQQAQLAQHQAEVERLQQHVSQLETQNGQANTRLQQQDRDIAKLQAQLQAAQGAATTGSGHP